MNITGYSTCTCGAITIYGEGDSYSCSRNNLEKFFPHLDLSEIEKFPQSYMCDYCVNHYGLDLCGCGSGEPVGECTNDFDQCVNHTPMQIVDKYTHVRASNSWI